jgi:hypothetical protein
MFASLLELFNTFSYFGDWLLFQFRAMASPHSDLNFPFPKHTLTFLKEVIIKAFSGIGGTSDFRPQFLSLQRINHYHELKYVCFPAPDLLCAKIMIRLQA